MSDEQRAGGAEDVPDGVVVVVVRLARLPERVFAGAIGGHEHGVVKRGVEDLRLLRRFALQFDSAERLIPLGDCGGVHGVEIEAGNFGGEILPGLRDADEGDADLHEHRPIRGGEGEPCAGVGAGFSMRGFAAGRELVIEPCAPGCSRRVQARIEIDGVGVGLLVPSAGDAGGSGDFSGRENPDRGPGEQLIFALLGAGDEAVADIEEEIGGRALRVTKAVDGAAARSRDVDADVVAGERDRVEAGRSMFIGARRRGVERREARRWWA